MGASEKNIVNQWILGIKPRSKDIFDMSGFSAIIPPDGRYYADPFLYEKEGKTYIFFEDYNYYKGVISVIELYEDMTYSDPVQILEEPFHLSFPFLYEETEKLYMIPESGDSNAIKLYECTEFPYKWKFVKNLVEPIHASDVILHKSDDWVYLITTVQPELRDEFVVFRTKDSILNHMDVVGTVNIKNSRPAGNPFMMNGNLLLPVQKSTDFYGQAVIFMEIIIKTEGIKYKQIGEIGPWAEGLIGIHTFNFNEKYVIVDGKRKVYNSTNLLR